MKPRSPKIIYLLFFLSGAAGLIYEIVWIRYLVLIFGSTTNSIVAVIAAFLGGLAIGSLTFGKFVDNSNGKKLLKVYSNLEILIGLFSLLTLFLIPQIKNIYALFSDGSSQDFVLLFIKFLFTILVLIIPTFLMGATLPTLTKHLNLLKNRPQNAVSILYAVNTFGAVLGVLLSAFILIELFGLKTTLIFAALINFLIGAVAKTIKVPEIKSTIKINSQTDFLKLLTPKTSTVILAFSLSGLISIAYEVLWTRILTPTVGTVVYAFSEILALYLLGIAIGSLFYKNYAKIIKSNFLAFAFCEFAIGFFALGTVYLTSNQIAINKNLMVLVVLLPATIFMGLTFPAVIALIAKKEHLGKLVGLSYFANTIGSIAGGFLTSFFFLPKIGSSQSVILLSILNFLIAALFVSKEQKSKFKIPVFTLTIIMLIFTAWLFGFKRNSLNENVTQWRINWAQEKGINYLFEEDEVASVFAYRDEKNLDQNLFLDGVPTTGRVGETKLMAHIPILLHRNPKDVLVIAFGMGTTFRSSLTHDIPTDVVELVPSVIDAFTLFHTDSNEVLSNPKGKIIINDGRNYVFLTKKKYDIVTIDPPPPFNAAGTTVLYSIDFYAEIAKKLRPGGIVSQWIWFGSRQDDISMAIKSFTEVFPHVLVFKSPQSTGGLFLEGSFEQIKMDEIKFSNFRSSSKPAKDLAEIYQDFTINEIPTLLIGDREDLTRLIQKAKPITDNEPNTEYFLLRKTFTNSPDLTKVENSQKFIDSIKVGR